MKKIYLVLVCFLSLQMLHSQTSGGPDAFGYTWKNSDDPQGPVFNWIDITSTGTLINGIADDNAVGPIALPFQFNYYDSSYSEIKVGSNGWVSFNNVGNLAHCFAAIPTAGGVNNLVCPFAADLNFTDGSVSNYGSVYYQALGTDTFVVSYIDAPFWVNTMAGFEGHNTFQVIFNATDHSITFQYLLMEDVLANYVPACTRNTVAGIENKNGTTGLEVYADTILPPDSMAVKFSCNGCFTVGIEESGTQLRVFPNPASDFVNIETEDLAFVEILDEQGRVFKRVYSSTVVVSDYPAGIYFLKVQTENAALYRKLLILR